MALLRLKHQVHSLTSDNENLARKASRASERVTELEGIVHSRQNGSYYNATSNVLSYCNYDAALSWQRDTFFDATHDRNIKGNVVVVARDHATPNIISDTLGIDKQIYFHKPNQSIYRIAVGNKGQAGVSAVKSFLNNVRDRVPQAWKVQRQRTPITMQRERSLNIINSRIQHIINSEPSLIGMKSHVAPNGTAIYLSYADRQSALDPKNAAAPAYLDPVWHHFPYDASLKNGTGGLNYNTPTSIRDVFIEELIDTTIPFSNAHALRDNNNNNNNNNNNIKSPLVVNHTPERSQHVFLGLMSIFLSLIKMQADRYGNTKGSRKSALSDNQDHMDDYTDDDDDSWTSMSD